MTPSFRFGLERVKSLREQAEDSAREELARELALRMRGEAILRRAAAAAAAARDTGRDSAVRGASGADLLAAQHWIEVADRRRREAALDLDRQDAEVDARRAALVEASREREVISRLEARRRDEHQRETARLAQIDLDEVALTVHRRRGVAA
ncbi:MAG TPA: flagellar export protein FliJ [Solirubrobacteraceae bacterium]|nr:flagellar export protein FliJ [Solirubrobacteraceae bacterium]